jgi:hypothetical protein
MEIPCNSVPAVRPGEVGALVGLDLNDFAVGSTTEADGTHRRMLVTIASLNAPPGPATAHEKAGDSPATGR